MYKESLSRLINSNKRIIKVEKPKKKLFKVVLWKYTGRSILKTVERYYSGLKHDFEVIFKPVKHFTKKNLSGLSKFDLTEQRLEVEESKNIHQKHIDKTPTPPNENMWFLCDEPPKKTTEKRVTLKKADGTIVGLDAGEVYF